MKQHIYVELNYYKSDYYIISIRFINDLAITQLSFNRKATYFKVTVLIFAILNCTLCDRASPGL